MLIIETDPLFGLGADDVQKPGGGNAVDRDAGVAERRAAHREARLKVVAGRHAWQCLDGPHRIVGRHPAQVLQRGRPEGADRHSRIARARSRR